MLSISVLYLGNENSSFNFQSAFLSFYSVFVLFCPGMRAQARKYGQLKRSCLGVLKESSRSGSVANGS